MERSRGREGGGVDRKQGNPVAERGGSGEQLGQPGGELGVFFVGKQKRAGRGRYRCEEGQA